MVAAIFSVMLLAGAFVWAVYSIYDHFKDPDNSIPLFVKLVFFGLMLAFFGMMAHVFIWQYTHPKEVAAKQARYNAAIREANSPHLIYQKDGCDVYRFVDGINHYFVRCPNARTTTIGQHEVTTHHLCGPRGQQCSETHIEQEEITTEGQ